VNEGAAAILPDLSCDIAASIFNMGQPSDAPQDRYLAATSIADPGRWNREHSIKREFPQRAAKLGADLVR
jgi:hypothetical protein